MSTRGRESHPAWWGGQLSRSAGKSLHPRCSHLLGVEKAGLPTSYRGDKPVRAVRLSERKQLHSPGPTVS